MIVPQMSSIAWLCLLSTDSGSIPWIGLYNKQNSEITDFKASFNGHSFQLTWNMYTLNLRKDNDPGNYIAGPLLNRFDFTDPSFKCIWATTMDIKTFIKQNDQLMTYCSNRERIYKQQTSHDACLSFRWTSQFYLSIESGEAERMIVTTLKRSTARGNRDGISKPVRTEKIKKVAVPLIDYQEWTSSSNELDLSRQLAAMVVD